MANYPFTRVLLSIHTTPSPPAEATNPEYSDMIIIFVCLMCALICAVGILGVIQWTCLKRSLRSTRASASASATHNDVEAAHPSECFKKKVVESLPRLVYKSSISEGSKEECVVCLSEFNDGEGIRVLPRCAHVFHVACIDTWLITSHSLCCPSCRQSLVVKSCHKCKSDVSVRPPPPQPEIHYLP